MDEQSRSRAAGTSGGDYTERLVRLESTWWKRWLNVQLPYRWNLRRLRPGFVLDVGCGIGRNLLHIDGHGIGVDHNEESVRVCRARGLEAYVAHEFWQLQDDRNWSFDTLLLAHVLEHMPRATAEALLAEFLPLVRPGGKVIFITPQEAGYRSDATHVEFLGFDQLQSIASASGLRVVKAFSYPFPRSIGRYFRYNEFVVVAEK